MQHTLRTSGSMREAERSGGGEPRAHTNTDTDRCGRWWVRGRAATEMRAVRAFASTRLCGPIGGVDGADNHRLKVALLRDRAQLQVEHLHGSVGRRRRTGRTLLLAAGRATGGRHSPVITSMPQATCDGRQQRLRAARLGACTSSTHAQRTRAPPSARARKPPARCTAAMACQAMPCSG